MYFFPSLIDGCLKYKNKEKPKMRPDPRLKYDVKIGKNDGAHRPRVEMQGCSLTTSSEINRYNRNRSSSIRQRLCLILKAAPSEGCICQPYMSSMLSYFRKVTITFPSKKTITVIYATRGIRVSSLMAAF